MKILLVDDSKSARYALRLQLQRHGVDVDTADSAESAFEKLVSELPDAILMDHMMPGLNGFEALDVLRQSPRTARIPVIMCTSHEEADFVATAKRKGVFGILPKSAAPDLLPEMLERLQAQLTSDVAASSATAAPRGLSEEDIGKLVDARLEARLSKLLPPMLEELRRNLTEKLLGEARHLVDERLASDHGSRSSSSGPTMADLQAISTRLATETLPDLLKRSLDAERARIMEAIERQLRDAIPKGATAGHGQEVRSDAQEESIALKAASMARRESQETLEVALLGAKQGLQAVERNLHDAMNKVYALVALAALAGMGSAAAVFYLLQP